MAQSSDPRTAAMSSPVPSRLWRLTCFALFPFLISLAGAAVVTAYHVTRNLPAFTYPSNSNEHSSLSQFMNLSPVVEKTAPGFTLTDQRGKSVSLADFRGKAVLLAFFDSRCTEVCPVIATELIAAEHDLGARASGVAFVAINVNPLAESVADVQHFSQVHGLSALPNWYFLTGTTKALSSVWNAYGIFVGLPRHAKQTVHADYMYFVNPLGKERFLAEPDIYQRPNGTGYLPKNAVDRWGNGIALYLNQAASG